MSDYDASWDYTIDSRPPKGFVRLVKRIVKDHKLLLECLSLPKPRIQIIREECLGVEESALALARYISGSCDPDEFCMVLNARTIVATCERLNEGLRWGTETTIVHEYGHAYLENNGMDAEHHDKSVEGEIEAFVHCVCDRGGYEDGRTILDAVLDKFLANT